ncbi:MAG: NAD(P)H-hydrate dehydratase [Sandarakinorhabdus sp.]|nr:NAD(P)H-hydrate dehydratase [Sandarakinorhabdus sp.]
MPLLTAAEMRGAEAAAVAAGVSAATLMARAASAAAQAIIGFTLLRDVLVLCGPGNNGGDGFAVAAELRSAGLRVRVACDSKPVAEPGASFVARWDGPVEALADAAAAPVIVDALFGTGLTRALTPKVQAVLGRLRRAGAIIVALDLPSGIDADSGAALGVPLNAALTIAFGTAKRGHVLGAGRRACGRYNVVDIGVAAPADAATLVMPPIMAGLDDDMHKYMRGGVLVINGDQRGAAQLAALAALRAGAGAVTMVGAEGDGPAHAVMHCDDDAALALLGTTKVRAVAIGPGLADTPRSRGWLKRLLAGTMPLVADAGALGLLDALEDVAAPMVMTPHAGEFARLFGAPGADRVAAVSAAARRSGAVVVAKGRETIIAAADGRVAINVHASPWLATAGSGDVLTGIITALLAQGMAPFDAAQAGVWLHGDAGVRAGPGLIADDIPGLLPVVLGAL